MHRSVVRNLTVISLAGLLAAASLPAHAKSSRPKQHRGKKAIGEIVSFDAATSTLTVDLPGDEDFTGAVAPDAQVKLDHRGWARKGSDHEGNPTKGSLEDLVAGTPVLRMKVEDELVTKIRIRPLPDQAPLPLAEDGTDGDALPGDEAPAGDTPGEDDSTGDDPTGEDDPTGDDTSTGDDSTGDEAPADDSTGDEAPADDSAGEETPPAP